MAAPRRYEGRQSPRTAAIVTNAAAVSCRDQGALVEGEAPGPVDPYSANRAVFSLSGFFQLFHPSGMMWEPIQQRIYVTLA